MGGDTPPYLPARGERSDRVVEPTRRALRDEGESEGGF